VLEFSKIGSGSFSTGMREWSTKTPAIFCTSTIHRKRLRRGTVPPGISLLIALPRQLAMNDQPRWWPSDDAYRLHPINSGEMIGPYGNPTGDMSALA
jgi:hypothetical protein